MSSNISCQIAKLPTLSRQQLVELWLELFRKPRGWNSEGVDDSLPRIQDAGESVWGAQVDDARRTQTHS